jgi:APA family basic amino acid/polyamine antiporter
MDSTPAPTLQRTLGGWQVLFYGLGSMLGAGIYALVGKAAGIMGNAVWAAFLAAMVGALLTGLSYASLGSRHPRAGGAAYIIGQAFHSPVLSTVVGIAVMMSGLTSMATGLQAIALKLAGEGVAGIAIKLIAIALAAGVGFVIYRGIRESIRLNTLCTAIEAGGLLFIIIVGCRYWGSVDYFATPLPPVNGDSGVSGLTMALVMQGAVLTFFSFIGFEDILNVSEEVKDPRRDVPFGLVGAMIVGTLIYVGVAVTAVSVLGWERLSKSANPLDDVAVAAAGSWFGGIGSVYFAVTIFAIGNTALLNYLMGSRLLYGMGTQKLLPAALASIHPRRHTPHVAVVVLLVIVAVLILAGDVKALAEATVLLLLAVFTAMNAALFILKRRPGEEPGGFEISSAIPIAGALVCAVLFANRLYQAVVSTDPASRQAPFIALIILAAGFVIGFVHRRIVGTCR